MIDAAASCSVSIRDRGLLRFCEVAFLIGASAAQIAIALERQPMTERALTDALAGHRHVGSFGLFHGLLSTDHRARGAFISTSI